MIRPVFQSVALDVDSTLCGIEGIDWLASLRGAEVAAEVARATDRAMQGDIPLQDVYGTRIRLVSPSREEVERLADAYRAMLAPGARNEVKRWRDAGVHIVLLSGGLRPAIEPVAKELGFQSSQVNANDIEFDERGALCRFDTASPLTTATGKRDVLESLHLPRPLLAVGDGMTDLAMKEVADAFVAFTGFAARESVVSRADYIARSFADLSKLILGE